MQFVFLPTRGMNNPVFILREVHENFLLYINFYYAIPYWEKAFNWVFRNVLRWAI